MAGGYPVPFIKFREVDKNGFPLAGGRIYSYAAGTSTPLPTFFDQDLAAGHENQNPTILDASGRANIWVAAGVGYKFVCTDALGNTQWTQDNVQVPASATAPPDGGGGPAPSPTAGVPTGTIVPYAGSTAPADWLLCDGSGASRTTYSALFAVCGETYGPGNGSTTFNLPNLTQRFPLGKAVSGVGATLGAVGGQIDHVHTGPSHTHPVSDHHHQIAAHQHQMFANAWAPSISGAMGDRASEVLLTQPSAPGGGAGAYLPQSVGLTGMASALDTGNTIPTVVNTSAAGTGNTGVANPPFIALNFIIKT